MAGLIYFSYRYGKLISPAVVLLLVSTLPMIFLLLIRTTKPSIDAQRKGRPIPILPHEITVQVAEVLTPAYYLLFLLGIGLIGTAVIIKLFKRFSQMDKH